MDWDRIRAGLREHESARHQVAVGDTSGSIAGGAPPPKPPAAKEEHPERIGPYRIAGVLGKGGVGVVYVARSERLDRLVAIKVLRVERQGHAELLERLDIEARAAARLRHPNIVGIHEVGEDAGRRYLVMELVAGRSLAARLRDDGVMPARDAARMVERLARALEYAHSRAVLHRDIKPANVLLSETGEPLLTDFGLAKVLEEGAAPTPTVSGQVMGTPAYMPPEQARGEQARVDRRSDVYALGATLHEMLTGRPPWDGETVMATLAKVTNAEPVPPPSRLRPDLDADLETIVLECLEKDPGDRYASAEELAADLARFLADEPILARRPSLVVRGRKWLRRNRTLARALAASAGVAIVLLVLGSVAFVRRLRAERDRADQASQEAELQADRARERAAVAQDALRVLIYEVRDQLADVPGERVRQVRGALLEHALAALEQLRDAELTQGSKTAAAEAQRQIGELHLARPGEGLTAARAALERAVALSRQAVAETPGLHARADLALSLERLAEVTTSLGDESVARALLAEANQVAERVMAEGVTRGPAVAARISALRQLGMLARLDGDLPRAAKLCAQAVELAREHRVGLVEALASHALVLDDLGDLPATRAALEETAALERETDSTRLPTTLGDLAEVQSRQGDLGAAVATIASAVVAERALLAEDPEHPGRRDSLAGLLLERSELLDWAGDGQGALSAIEEAVALRRELVEEQPDALAFAAQLAPTLAVLSHRLERAGDHGRARTAAEEAVALHRAIVGERPSNEGARWDLSLALIALGRLIEVDDIQAATAALEEALTLRRELVQRDPSDMRAAQGIAVGLLELGEARFRQDDVEGARAAFVEAVEVTRRLRAHDPTRHDHEQNLMLALYKVGKVEEREGRPEAAIASYAGSIEVARAILARDPARVEGRRHLGMTASTLALLHARRGARAEAETFATTAVEVWTALVEAPGALVGDRRDLAVALSVAGELRELAGDPAGALARHEQALAAVRAALAVDSTSTMFRRDLAISLERTGHLRRELRDPAGSARDWAESLAVRRALFQADPRSVLARRDLSGGLVAVAQVHERAGRFDEAVALWTEAVENHRALVAAAPRHAPELRSLEGGLERARAGQRRARLAAGDGVPETSDEHLEVAYVCYEKGQHAAAVEHFALALQDEALRADLRRCNLYNAACAAALASAAAEDPAAKAALRARALAWLKDDAERHRQLLARVEQGLARADLPADERDALEARERSVAEHAAHARRDPDLASLRGPELDAILGE